MTESGTATGRKSMHEGEARERHGQVGAGLMRRAHAMPFGAEILPDGVRFALWAPTAREVTLLVDGSERPMPADAQGWRRLVVPEARPGSRYAFRIDGGLRVPDPASRFQPDDVQGLS